MQFVWVLCLLFVLTQTQAPPKKPSAPSLRSYYYGDYYDYYYYYYYYGQCINNNIYAPNNQGNIIYNYVQRLSSLTKKLDEAKLNKGEKKLLNNLLLEGIINEALKAMGDLQGKLMKILDKENAPMTAIMLVSQLVPQELSDAIKAEVRKKVVDGDKTTLNEDTGLRANTKRKGYGNRKRSKKVLCIHAPDNLQYCVSQLKEP